MTDFGLCVMLINMFVLALLAQFAFVRPVGAAVMDSSDG